MDYVLSARERPAGLRDDPALLDIEMLAQLELEPNRYLKLDQS